MKILKKQVLVDYHGVRIVKLEISSVEIAKKAQAGQFIALMVCEEGERIPLTVVDKDESRGSFTLIFQEAGYTTGLLGQLEEGDSLYSLVGPLGHPTEIKKYSKVFLVGGGVGIAEIYPVARSFKKAGVPAVSIIGSRNKDLLILEKELKEASDKLFVTTDDGSYSRKGFVTEVLKEALSSEVYDASSGLVYAVGPISMMRSVAKVTRDFNIKTYVSLNALMVDATGMCGCCRVTVGGELKFSCVDGPDFDAHLVDWDELTKRNKIYETKEKHICNLNKL